MCTCACCFDLCRLLSNVKRTKRNDLGSTSLSFVLFTLLLLFGISFIWYFIITNVNNNHNNNNNVNSNKNLNVNTFSQSERPNIIFVLLDDMGRADISASGAEYTTPNLDSFYSTSVHIDNYYVSVLCSPSRSVILSGRNAWNMGLSDFEPFKYGELMSLPIGLPTIGDLLKEYTSYSTYLIGKWHVGYATVDHGPLHRGFDHFFGFYGSGIKYTNKSARYKGYHNYKWIDWWHDTKLDLETKDTYSTFVSRDKTIDVINKHTKKSESESESDPDYNENPFFIFLSLQAPHFDLEYVESVNMKECDKIQENDNSTNSRYNFCLNMMAVDDITGDIISKLKENNMYDNTIIIFSSDNGGDSSHGSCNYPLRGEKVPQFQKKIFPVVCVCLAVHFYKKN